MQVQYHKGAVYGWLYTRECSPKARQVGATISYAPSDARHACTALNPDVIRIVRLVLQVLDSLALLRSRHVRMASHTYPDHDVRILGCFVC